MPRRHWDISFSGATNSIEFSPAVDLVLAIMGIGGIMAVTGALGFILIAVKSVFLGERLGEITRGVAMRGVPSGLTRQACTLESGPELVQTTRKFRPSKATSGL